MVLLYMHMKVTPTHKSYKKKEKNGAQFWGWEVRMQLGRMGLPNLLNHS